MENKVRRILWKKMRKLEDDKDTQIVDLKAQITSLQERIKKIEISKAV